MELLHSLRWDEIFGFALADPGLRLLAGIFGLMLLTAYLCHWLYVPAAPDGALRPRD